MNKLLTNLIRLINKLTPPQDKLGHFFWGFWYSFIGLILDNIFGWGSLLIFSIPVLVGVIKELYDYSHNWVFDYKDIIYTSIPCVVLTLIA